VPALLAAQHDIARQVRAMRRGLRAPVGGLRWGLALLWVLVLGWGLVTLGHAAWRETLHPLFGGALPALAEMPPLTAALLLFLAGAGLVALLGYLAGALAMALRGRRAA
jgi:hypothetical protein